MLCLHGCSTHHCHHMDCCCSVKCYTPAFPLLCPSVLLHPQTAGICHTVDLLSSFEPNTPSSTTVTTLVATVMLCLCLCGRPTLSADRYCSSRVLLGSYLVPHSDDSMSDGVSVSYTNKKVIIIVTMNNRWATNILKKYHYLMNIIYPWWPEYLLKHVCVSDTN